MCHRNHDSNETAAHSKHFEANTMETTLKTILVPIAGEDWVIDRITEEYVSSFCQHVWTRDELHSEEELWMHTLQRNPNAEHIVTAGCQLCNRALRLRYRNGSEAYLVVK